MVVDDDPGICDLISTVLAKIGVTSIGLPGVGELARALGSAQPSIVFLDIALDRSDAVDGIRVLRDTGFKGAVQLISGKDQALLDGIRSIGERSGLDMLAPLRKPFRSEHLRSIFCSAPVRPLKRVLSGAPPAAKNGEADHAERPRADLAEGLEQDWIEVAYQPKVDLRHGLVVGAEGLARLRHPVHGMLAPLSFLPDASSKALAMLTEFIIRRAFLDWQALDRMGGGLRFAVNAPVEALISGGLPEFIREHRPTEKHWPGLIIEITEDEAVRELDAVAEAAVQLQIYNTRLAIDDFGLGYSSFARLKQLPFCELKLDRSYVQDCATDKFNAGICRSIVDLAHAAGASCVAEGIESIADGAALVRMGCDFGQGYLFARPMSLADLAAFLSRKN